MADSTSGCSTNRDFKEAVCIDVGRVFDSCCDRDCLEDLRVYFSEDGQSAAYLEKSAIIKEKLTAYILSEVNRISLDLKIDIQLAESEPFTIQAIIVQGNISPYKKQMLSNFIQNNLGVSGDQIIWK